MRREESRQWWFQGALADFPWFCWFQNWVKSPNTQQWPIGVWSSPSKVISQFCQLGCLLRSKVWNSGMCQAFMCLFAGTLRKKNHWFKANNYALHWKRQNFPMFCEWAPGFLWYFSKWHQIETLEEVVRTIGFCSASKRSASIGGH